MTYEEKNKIIILDLHFPEGSYTCAGKLETFEKVANYVSFQQIMDEFVFVRNNAKCDYYVSPFRLCMDFTNG